jgi:hypothetical protein
MRFSPECPRKTFISESLSMRTPANTIEIELEAAAD